MEKQKVLRSWDFVSQDRAGQPFLSLIDTLSSAGKGDLAITIAMPVMDFGIVILEDNFNRQPTKIIFTELAPRPIQSIGCDVC